MRMYDLIEKKKQGQELTKEEIHFLISEYMRGQIMDYQMSAFLMAVCFQNMTEAETFYLTMEMRDSGKVLDLSGIEGIKVDKHSTGGVGDKTTIVLIALVAALGVPVAKMSGRGLGHTGGTIDKFECFPGFCTEMSAQEFTDRANTHKIVLAGQSSELAPADHRLYALRDVTATVDHISLIAASIMSKKLASGADAIVLDVTYGSGAFMKTKEEALKLAGLMVKIGQYAGKDTRAVITCMEEPLGFNVGNALEVKEAVEALRGNGRRDLMEVVYALGAQMLLAAKRVQTQEEALSLMKAAIQDGSALEKLKELIVSQHGDATALDDLSKLPKAMYEIPVYAKATGIVVGLDARTIGLASMKLGSGRQYKDDSIDLSVGIVLKKKCGEFVKEGEILAILHSNSQQIDEIVKEVKAAYAIRPYIEGEEESSMFVPEVVAGIVDL